MADILATLSTSISITSWPFLQFLEALQLRRLHRHQCLLGSSSAEEGCTDTNAYWKLFSWGRLHRHQCLLEALQLRKAAQTPMLTGSSSAEKAADTIAYWKWTVQSLWWISFSKFHCRHDMMKWHVVCVGFPQWSWFYSKLQHIVLASNDMSLKFLLERKKKRKGYEYNYSHEYNYNWI